MSHRFELASATSTRSTYRRSYKKSTLGCDACKSRKIKCDEARPVCLNCRRHYTSATSCRYSHEHNPAHLVHIPKPTKISTRPITLNSTNILALKLVHHYTLSVGISQPSGHPQKSVLARRLWEVEIPSIAFVSEVVLNALLGISAWHLWAVNPVDQNMKLVSRDFFGQAIRLQMAAINKNDTKQLIAPFIAGIILAHHSWLLSYTDDNTDYTRRLHLATFYLCSGYRTLGKKLPPTWSKYAYLDELAYEHERPMSIKHDGIMEEALEDNGHIFLTIQNANVDQEHKDLCLGVLKELLSTYDLISNQDVDVSVKEHSIVTFLHRVDSRFVNLLECQMPLAMGLLARVWAFLAVLDKLSTAWYIHGTGQYRVYTHAILNISNAMPDEWAWMMHWPFRLLSKVA